MARVLLAWELGAQMGHIDRLLVLARALRRRGHDVLFVLRDLSRAQPRVVAEGFVVMQAPVWLHRLANAPKLNSYAGVLASAGWLDAAGLAGLLSAWRSTFVLWRPDVLVCDHAPTALLAARGQLSCVWCIGSSFVIPPCDGAAFPAFDAREQAAAASFDATVLAPVNSALALLGTAPLARLTDLFAPAHKALTTLPEIAHYGAYGNDVAWAGPTFVDDSGAAPPWPDGAEGADGAGDIKSRVFAYLEPGHAEFEALAVALRCAPWRSLIYARGLAESAATRLASPQLRLVAAPLRMDQTLHDADLIISHGGQGTLAAAALAGKPQLWLPTHVEQALAVRRAAAHGLGLAVEPGAAHAAWGTVVAQLLSSAPMRAAALAMRERYTGQAPQQTGERLAEWIAHTASSLAANKGSRP